MSELRELKYEHDGITLTGDLAMPSGPGPHPGVLVMHSALGRDGLMQHRARDLAALGYAALATDMYGAVTEEAIRKGTPMLALHTDPARLRGRARAGLEALSALKQVDANRLGAIGYCFGGQCVLELARSGAPVKGVVSFHGLLTTKIPGRAGDVKAQVLSITGAHDPYAPAEDLQSFQSEMAAAGVDWQTTVYGTGYHAFTDPVIGSRTDIRGVRYDPLLDRLSWAQATAFLDAVIAH